MAYSPRFPKPSIERLISLFSAPVRCGFPSSAEDHTQLRINLNEELLPHPEASFLSFMSIGIQCKAQPNDQRLYDAAEDADRAGKRGLWSDTEPVPPWEFRRNNKP